MQEHADQKILRKFVVEIMRILSGWNFGMTALFFISFKSLRSTLHLTYKRSAITVHKFTLPLVY